MNDYQLFLDTLYRIAKKLRVDGVNSIVKHLNAAERSALLAGIAGKGPAAAFLCDSLNMLVAGLSLEELTFYMDGYRHRLITHDKADIHLVNLVFRTVWALAHSNWSPEMCTEFGRATIPGVHSWTRKEWLAHCEDLEVERTRTNVNWDRMLEEIKQRPDG